MKRMFFVVWFLLFFGAQNYAGDFSIRAGMNHSWLSYPDVSELENEFNSGYSFGAAYNNQFPGNIYFSAGFRVFTAGRYDEISYMDMTETVEIDHMYLSIPIKAGYTFWSCLTPYINLEPGYLLSSRIKYDAIMGDAADRDILEEMNKFNLFMGPGLKFDFGIMKQRFSLSGEINFGLLRVPKEGEFTDGALSTRSWVDWRTREILVTLEYHL